MYWELRQLPLEKYKPCQLERDEEAFKVSEAALKKTSTLFGLIPTVLLATFTFILKGM